MQEALSTAHVSPPLGAHLWRAARAVVGREIHKFLRQPARLASALVRPLLWFVVFATGFHNVFGVSIIPPYETYIEYKVYMLPGLLGMIALFNGMQSSLSLVYDREMGLMRLLLTAPLHRAWLLAFKLLAGTSLSVLQMVVFLAMAWLLGVEVEPLNVLLALPTLVLAALLMASMGLVLSVHVRQLENFAGAMNFVIFPMFFISSALYPLWKFEEAGAWWLFIAAQFNPFTQAVETMRFALHGQTYGLGWAVGALGSMVFFALAVRGYDPQRGAIRQRGAA
ncbi:ABC transporter permease [Limnohabitans radicicola]|uniref:Transport permease protein n=1 Tax=Limnohabitans radicicola TaxID=2771427 RepID=A0A927IL75_9BURK|nr:ABC transporter permease [Limnohabitans radicicola]MBD8049865.1 ABC transporter permease [Limnohabitans radicicola]